MGYFYKSKHFDKQRDLVKFLIDECYDRRRPNYFNISRDFDVVSDDGRAFTVALKFDNNEILYKMLWIEESPKKENRIAAAPHKYILYATNFVDSSGERLATNTEVVAFLKKHAGTKYTLSVDGGERIWTWYADGLLYYGDKIKKIK